MDGIPPDVFAARRAAVFRALGHGVMVLPAAPVQRRSRDTELPYRPDSELFYVTGATEPGTVAVLVGGDEPRFILFVREKDPEVELWSGPLMGPDEAGERLGGAEAYPLSELDLRLGGLMRAGDRIHVRLGCHAHLDRLVVEALADARARGPRKGTGPRSVVDPGEILDELRLVKDAHEIRRLRAAAELSVEGHRAGLASLRPGAGEWEVQAAVEGVFRRGGASGPGFGTIVGSGANACVLHYVDNRRVIEAGDAVLVDAGAEVALYQGDVTRTWPADGTFRAPQRALYEVVEAARTAAVARVSPGTAVDQIHAAATRAIVEGLVGLGVLAGDVDDLLAQEAYRALFPHQTSHWLGLDVHEPGDYVRGGAPRVLEPGMVLTVEPGVYVPAVHDGRAAPFAGIGIRIEDDLLVTSDGHENLTAALPTSVDDVEALARSCR